MKKIDPFTEGNKWMEGKYQPEDSGKKLVDMFGNFIGNRIGESRPLPKIRSMIRISNLPDHYKEAVKGILEV